MKALPISITAHAGILAIAAFSVSHAPAVTVPHYNETFVISTPYQVQPPVVPPTAHYAKIAVPTQSIPARIRLGQSVISPKLALTATVEQPSFGELSVDYQPELPASRVRPVRSAPQVKLAGFEQEKQASKLAASAPVPETALPVVMPTVIHMRHPEYTLDALHAEVEGVVDVRVTFHKNGTVRVGSVVNGLGYGLDEEAVRVAESITFEPATYNGQPVEFSTMMHINFQLVD